MIVWFFVQFFFLALFKNSDFNLIVTDLPSFNESLSTYTSPS
jgi:hypothetical protein